ncbi:3-hydroxyacyl-ACP dehydratase [Oceanidesulfovibrio indonesiensis]|uniref:3-hydroxyacyl-ACP dehydratase n=1 Tax=Oceanidesulfovibrio indonesiensis TaxID=54767 RepID=A0A7M3MGM4_9BACT|nr:acyl-CoA dehydratase activase [Oceanidesulfovibrio indonesiensis]TVM18472.1 3-hydroxyacyl-ACP dehydratase [Oceanidesulfovibrio indonesiensis]
MIAGIDIGSRSIELVCLRDGERVLMRRLPTTFDPLAQIDSLLADVKCSAIAATGYGRALAAKALAQNGLPAVETITEIKAYALGAAALAPEARTVLDIGGQDTKAISLAGAGRVLKFEMNDRCAAGTGKFLEHVASVFQIAIEDFGAYALQGQEPLAINSMCTVFAETEATSLMARGYKPQDIALGLHASIVKRTMNMLGRVGLHHPVLFAGGVANNPCVVKLVTEALGHVPIVPDEPEMVGALGAALHAARLSVPA